MKIKLLIFAILFAVPFSAQALGAGASAGVYIPLGDISDYDTGFGANIFLDIPLVPPVLGLRTAGNYAQAKYSKGGIKDNYHSYGIQVLAMLRPPVPVVDIYAGAGYGVYSNVIDSNINARDYDGIGHGAVVVAGVGKSFSIIYLGLNYQYTFDKNIGKSGKYNGHSIGLGLGLSI